MSSFGDCPNYPHPPNSGSAANDDNEGCNDNYDGSFDDNDGKNDQKTYK